MRSSLIMPRSAMVLAAGLGTRLRPLTDDCPKALTRVQDKALIDVALDRLAEAGIERAIVNLHHLGDKIRHHLKDRQRPKIVYSPEAEILETGGGIAKALPLLGSDPFFVINAKIVWLNGKIDCLRRLAEAFDPDKMDALLLLHPMAQAIAEEGLGDFMMDPDGKLHRRQQSEVAPFIYASIHICHPRLFVGAPSGKFSLNLLWDRAMEQDRLYGIRHDGQWAQVSSLRQLEEVERYLRDHDYRI